MEQLLTSSEFASRLEVFETAFLCTRRPDGEELYARPMQLVKSDPSGVLWFATCLSGEKADAIQAHPQVAVTFQQGRHYATVSGRAEVHQDRARIRGMWSESLRPWFPDGPESVDLGLIGVSVEHGELWDQSGVLRRIRRLAEAGKAYATGGTLHEQPYDHARLS